MANWLEVGGAGALLLLGAYGVLKKTIGNLTGPVGRIEAELVPQKKTPAEPDEQNRLRETVEQIQHSVSSGFENWEERLERMGGNLERVDERLLHVERKLDNATKSRNAQGAVLEAQGSLLGAIDSRLEKVESLVRNAGHEE